MSKIFVAGHNGMVGSAIIRNLLASGVPENDIVTVSKVKLDLRRQVQVEVFFLENKFDEVYLSAAKVGGIHANNTYPAQFIYDNLMIQSNIIHSAFTYGVSKLLFLGSSCIYPRQAHQPMTESELLTGPLEPTNEPYAIAKIAGIKLCESYNREFNTDFRSVMPTNLYGPNDSYHPENSHVIPSLIKRFHDAKVAKDEEVIIWGTGTPRREFLHVDDMAAACAFVMSLSGEDYKAHTKPMQGHINVGSNVDITIAQLALMIKHVVGYEGNIAYDSSKLDGSPRKFMDSSLLNSLGWTPKIGLIDGLEQVYEDFCK